MFDSLILTLAQEDAPPTPLSAPAESTLPGHEAQPDSTDPGAAPQPGPGSPNFFIIIFFALMVMIIFSMGGQRKEKKKKKAMLENLKKGNRVQTIGGILGTVVEVRDDHVVVKIDENTNARVKFSRGAIQSVMQDEKE